MIEPVLGEPDNVSEFLENVQRGALQFVKEFKESVVGRNADLSSVNATSAFGKLALSPRKEELESIGNMDYEDFGMGKMAAPKPMRKYILHPGQLHYDLKHSPWRIGFLYKLFKVRLPYAKIYAFARKKQGKST